MQYFKPLGALLLIAATLTCGSAWADRGGHGRHGGSRVGVYIGAPLLLGLPFYGGYAGYGYGPGYGPGYGYEPYGYYGPATTIITTPAAPPVYIEQSSANLSGPANDGYWYYCQNPDGYYPYVKQCSTGWQQVASQPANR